MKNVLGVLLVAMFAACASTGKRPAEANGSYQRVVRHGQEYFCRDVVLTGSHVPSRSVCLTRDEISAQGAAADSFMHDAGSRHGMVAHKN